MIVYTTIEITLLGTWILFNPFLRKVIIKIYIFGDVSIVLRFFFIEIIILYISYIYGVHWNEGNSLALCNWKSHLIILALRSITVTDDGTTVLVICVGLLALSSVVWSDRDKTLTLSKTQSETLAVDDGDDRYGISDCLWSSSYSI